MSPVLDQPRPGPVGGTPARSMSGPKGVLMESLHEGLPQQRRSENGPPVRTKRAPSSIKSLGRTGPNHHCQCRSEPPTSGTAPVPDTDDGELAETRIEER